MLSRLLPRLAPLTAALIMAGCATVQNAPVAPKAEPVAMVAPTPVQLAAGSALGFDAPTVNTLVNKPLFKMTPAEVSRYVAFQQKAVPDFRARIAAIGRQNIGQPYILNLLGEYPFEIHDELPMFSLTHSDCVVFVEHTYAMAMARSWEEFFWLLQRIRYTNGVIGVATRNHYTELDWNVQNRWLVNDISAELGGARTAQYGMTVDRQKFLKNRHKTDAVIPVEKSTQAYVPKTAVADIEAQLKEGDFVNVISTRNGEYWASHVGLVVMGANGERHFLHSSEPQVREETFASFIKRAEEREARQAAAGKPGQVLAGFKFLRLNDNPAVPPMAPQPRPTAWAK